MIGQMPRWRPGVRKRRTLPSQRLALPRRARKRIAKEARAPQSVDTESMVFDSSNELPQATIVREPATFTELVVEGVVQWFRDRFRWMRPRMIPLVVAAVGLAMTVGAVNRLSRPPERVESSISASSTSSYQPGRIRVVMQQ
jgi:hypothetical protein